jgi:hypothetical protein
MPTESREKWIQQYLIRYYKSKNKTYLILLCGLTANQPHNALKIKRGMQNVNETIYLTVVLLLTLNSEKMREGTSLHCFSLEDAEMIRSVTCNLWKNK